MLKRTKQAIFSKKGESYIYVCVLVLFISALVSVVIMYMGLIAQVQIQKQDYKQKIDSCISEYAKESFDAVKQGENFAELVSTHDLKGKIYRKLGFVSSAETYTYDNGNCTVSRPSITHLSGGGFGVRVEYTVTFPISWGGKDYRSLQVPITITSFYKNK